MLERLVEPSAETELLSANIEDGAQSVDPESLN
jgi:hypothetical protein